MFTIDLTGKFAIVTGASKPTGLCFGQAQALRAVGAHVILLGGSPVNMAAMEARLQEDAKFDVIPGDLTDHDILTKGFARAMEITGGKLDILINGAGKQHRCPSVDFPMQQWESVLNLNLSAMFYLCQLAGPIMIAQGHGKIINIASMNTFLGGNIVPAYASSKAGVAGLTRALSNEWMPKGIQVNAIAPGFMESETSHDMMISPVGEAITKRIPAGHWGTADDLKGLTLLLASPHSDYMSGTVIPVDGGYLGV